jgi:hypothetical protein
MEMLLTKGSATGRVDITRTPQPVSSDRKKRTAARLLGLAADHDANLVSRVLFCLYEKGRVTISLGRRLPAASLPAL